MTENKCPSRVELEGQTLGRKRVFWNTIANYAGRTISAILNVACVPVYLHLLGAETYGLITLYAVIQGMMQLFDLGLSATLNRELARLSAGDIETLRERGNLLRTFEVAYWIGAAVMAVGILAASPYLAQHWLHSASLPAGTVTTALALMGVVIAVNWPIGLYSGGLLGLEEHVRLNLVTAMFSILRYGGAVLLLLFVTKAVLAYFAWQLIVAVLNVTSLRFLLWKRAGCVRITSSFSFAILKSRSTLLFGIGGTYLALILLTQSDKLIVSRLVGLEQLGYYNIAWTATSIFYFFYSPISAAFYPRITNLCSHLQHGLAAREYELGSTITMVLVFPACAVLCVFSRELATLWIADPAAVAYVHVLIRYLGPAAALAALLSISNMLQWAHGWTQCGFWANVGGVIIMVPGVAFMTLHYGICGAAVACSIVKVVQALVQFELTHERYMPTRKVGWYRNLALIGGASAGLAVTAKHLFPPAMGNIHFLLAVGCVWIISGSVVMWIPDSIRYVIGGTMALRFRKHQIIGLD
jgi:O-antigen/teichoic acid export membrane protein